MLPPFTARMEALGLLQSFFPLSDFTALHLGLSKYLASQDTCGPPTLTKHNITLVRLGYLLSLQAQKSKKKNTFCS